MNHTSPSMLIRLPNWVGDVVMALPALQAMKQSGIQLQLLGKPWIQDLLVGTDVSLLSVANSFWQAKKNIADSRSSDKALLLTNSFSSALMTRMAGCATIGYKTDGRQWLLKAGMAKKKVQHEVEYFWDIARFASQYWFPQLPWPDQIPVAINLPISQSVISNAQQLLLRANINKPFWLICPFAHGTGKNGESKIWPHWRELSSQLSSRNLVVCPGKSEEHLCAELVPEAIVIPGLNLAEYAAVMMAAERVIANDSGPMHMAAAVGAKTLGLFGVSDPGRTSPWGGDYVGTQGAWPTLSKVLSLV